MAKKVKKEKVKKVKETAPKKAKKKGSGDGSGFKQLLANHFEKALLGLGLLITLMLVWRGFQSREGIASNKTPATLNNDVAETESLVSAFTWDKDFKELRVDNQDFPQRADKALRRLDAEAYATNQLIRPPVSPPRTKRSDPDLYAATDLQVVAGYGILDKLPSRGRGDGPGGVGENQDGPVFQAQDEDEIDPDDKTIRPIPQTTGRAYQRGGEGRRGGGSDTEGIYFASITALVPVRKQLEDYKSHLANSKGEDEQRDAPNYVNWFLERSEVDAAGNATGYQRIAEGDKLRRQDSNRDMVNRNGNDTKEVIHPDFKNFMLTADVPPVEVRDPDRIFVHQRIVELSKKQYQKAKEREARRRERWQNRADRGMGDGPRGDRPRGDRSRGDRRQREGGFMQSPEMEFTRPRSREGGGQSYQQLEDSGLRASMPLQDAPEFYMFRYVDQSVEVGKTYRYRLQLVLDDPNDSMFNDPSEATLEPAVIARIRNSEMKKRRLTEFSEESAPVRIRQGQMLAVAKASPASTTLIRETGQLFQRPGTYPSAEVMALIFDVERATEIPGTTTVTPGSAVSFAAEVEVPLWNKNVLKKEKHEFRTDFDVLDIRGGDEADVKTITKPGQVLVYDRSGRMYVINELDTEDVIENFTFPEENAENRREGGMGREGGERREERRGGAEEGRGRRSRGDG